MKHNLFAFSLIAVLAGLASLPASLAQDLSTSYAVNPISPSDASPAAAAIRSRIEAWGYGDVMELSRDRSGVWHAHVIRNEVEIAVSVDKGGRITTQSANGQPATRCSLLYAIASRYDVGIKALGAPDPDHCRLDPLALRQLVASELAAILDGHAVITSMDRKVVVRGSP